MLSVKVLQGVSHGISVQILGWLAVGGHVRTCLEGFMHSVFAVCRGFGFAEVYRVTGLRKRFSGRAKVKDCRLGHLGLWDFPRASDSDNL